MTFPVKRRLIGVSGALALAAVAAIPVVAAAQDAAGAVKYRQSVMRAIGGHMGAMSGILKGEVTHQDDLKVHAQALAATAKTADKIFPRGSGEGDTQALPAVWSNEAQFKQRMTEFQQAAVKMSDAAASGDKQQVGAAFGALGKSCGACHDDFRKKK